MPARARRLLRPLRSVLGDRRAAPDEQTVTWPVKKGKWAVVVMNADGTPGVATEVSVGAKVGSCSGSASGMLLVGGRRRCSPPASR